MERLRKLQNHPVALIIVWLPTIVLLPGEWITIGGVVTSNTNLTRLVLFAVGLLAILWLTGRLPWLPQGTPARDAQEEPEKPQGYSPAERRETLDNLFYPPADAKRELGEECANFAITLTVFNEEQEARKEHAIARYAQEIREANPELDPFEVRRSAEAHFERQVEAAYKAELRNRALQLFDEAREQDAIAAKVRRTVDRPLAVELGDAPNLFLAIARRLGEDPVKYHWPPSIPLPADLPAQIDDLMREGMNLVKELEAPVEPRKVDGGWKVEGSDAPDAWWEKADDFQQRIRALLTQQHPALLTDFRDGYNGHLKKERKAKKPDPADDARSDAEKILGLANYERSGPRRVVEANLEGLAAARHRLGGQEAA